MFKETIKSKASMAIAFFPKDFFHLKDLATFFKTFILVPE